MSTLTALSLLSEGATYHGGVVVLDIGGATGALVVYADERFDGREIEISPVGASPSAHRTHNVIRARRGTAEPVFAAVFPDIPTGDYRVFPVDGSEPCVVQVAGGEVAELDSRGVGGD
jgi:hypothetical protein